MLKKLLPIFFIGFFVWGFCEGQNPLVKIWDKRYGGTDMDNLTTMKQSADGGYLLAGFSFSGMSGDKTQATWGAADYWIVKTDSGGAMQWNKDFGGTMADWLYCAHPTADGGYLLGGFSGSPISGDKSQPVYGGNDYWAVKINSLGIKEWDKDYGGTNDDVLTSALQTGDGGYLLGGYSGSGANGNKTVPTWGGVDYWIIRTDSLGSILWQKHFGGTGDDYLYSMVAIADGGYVVGGYSNSPVSGDKTQPSAGIDFWILKIDSAGTILWDKDYNITLTDYLYTMQQTADLGFILGGKCLNDSNDYCMVKIDSAGNQQWAHIFGTPYQEDEYGNAFQTSDGGYMISGASYGNAGGDKSENNLGVEQSWIIKTDSLGIIQWDKTIFTPGHDEGGFTLQTGDRCYVVANMSNSLIGGYKTWNNWGPDYTYDYWFVKFCDTTFTASTNQLSTFNFQFSIYPNPFTESLTIQNHFAVKKEIILFDVTGKEILRQHSLEAEIKLNTENIVAGFYLLRVGGENFKVVKSKL